MMAGLPKSGWSVLLLFLILIALPAVALAQTIEETPSDVLRPLADAVALNAFATDEQTSSLLVSFSVAIDAQQLTVDQALAMLALVSWATLPDAEATAAALSSLAAVLQGLTDGTITGDPLAALADLLAEAVTPDGVRNAIARAGGSDALLEQVDELVSAGVPPGILVRLTKQSFHDGVDEATIGLLLDELAATADGDAWGQVVNAVLGTGMNRHQDQETNVNANKNTDGKEQEEEENQHGNGGKKG